MPVIKNFKVVATVPNDPDEIKKAVARQKKLASQKKWRDKNKEKMSEYNATYFQNNKDEIYETRKIHEEETEYNKNYRAEIAKCICGKKDTRGNIMNHKQTCDTYLNAKRMKSIYDARPDLFEDGFCKVASGWTVSGFTKRFKIADGEVVKVKK